MMRRLHLRLTFFHAGFTSLILILLSLCFLYLSEKNDRENAWFSFREDMSSLVSGLEETTLYSHAWLKRMEGSKYKLMLMDNGKPYLFNRLPGDSNTSPTHALFDEIYAYYLENDPKQQTASSAKSSLKAFPYAPGQKQSDVIPLKSAGYFACGIRVMKNNVPLTVLVLAPLDTLKMQLNHQRLAVLLLTLMAIFMLTAFSWFYTKRLLLPIRKNQENQIQFTASASHELKTPLAVILACAAACETAPKDRRSIFLSHISQEGKRMQGLINDMLFLANRENKNLTYRMEENSPDTLLLNLYENYQEVAALKKLSLSLELPQNEIPFCLCDGERIYQALCALIQNAITYTGENGSIKLSLKVSSRFFFLSVSDSGQGISPEDKEHIFERFYRAQSSRSDKGHFGLGLCIASDITQAHKGSLYVKDNLPKGSVFTIRLPR